ncbi:MAG: 1-acyl-sn-glycerol-3-phosphate acyltransferase [Planctomycetes bacterium]|nr:1-acyl-sn-glycerol-3-phosphate acyltransferase [Planctomycetota bacterium]
MPRPDRSQHHLLDSLWSILRALRAAISILLYVLVSPSGFLPYVLFRLLHRGDPIARARILQRASIAGVRFMHWWLRTFRIIHFDWRHVRTELPQEPCVIVANHPTQLDPTVLMAVLGHACTIVKPSVYNRLLVRHLLAGALHFEGPTLDPMSVAHVVDHAVERLRLGFHLFVFPEARRSPQGQLRDFSRIAFEIAARANVPVVSLALRCEPCYLSRETPLLRPPARLPRVFVERLAIDRPDDFANDSRVLARRVEERYQAWVAAGMPPVAATHEQTPTLKA